jgi:hypothetical protein
LPDGGEVVVLTTGDKNCAAQEDEHQDADEQRVLDKTLTSVAMSASDQHGS